MGVNTQTPLAGLQLSVVHLSPSSQLTAVPLQAPLVHASGLVHLLPSSQLVVLLAYLQPLALSQVSVVHRLLSLQTSALPPAQLPPLQVSPTVHALPSLQLAVLFSFLQPLVGSQVSIVQGLPSSQLGAAPPVQVPAAQASPVVQALPSLHAATLLV